MGVLVSVCITTYRHESYLRQTLDGILGQHFDAPYEILIHDDCSPDGTVSIIREYAQRYPDIIRPMYEEVNQYSQNIPINETFNFPRARGKYIALCEGDDCWLNPEKLRCQIDYMEAHEDCTFSFTNGLVHDESGQREDRPFLPRQESERQILSGGSKDLSLADVVRLGFIPTASFVFRRDTLEKLPASFTEHMTQHGDLRMKLFLTAAGYARYESSLSVLYRENVPTSAFQVWRKEDRKKVYARAESVVRLCDDVDEYSKGKAAEALDAYRMEWLTVMAHNAPDLPTLHAGRLGKAFRSLPPQEKLRCEMRLVLPEKLAVRLAKIGR